jgi:hypothetical protein
MLYVRYPSTRQWEELIHNCDMRARGQLQAHTALTSTETVPFTYWTERCKRTGTTLTLLWALHPRAEEVHEYLKSLGATSKFYAPKGDTKHIPY